jgi:hypothetical protein
MPRRPVWCCRVTEFTARQGHPCIVTLGMVTLGVVTPDVVTPGVVTPGNVALAARPRPPRQPGGPAGDRWSGAGGLVGCGSWRSRR